MNSTSFLNEIKLVGLGSGSRNKCVLMVQVSVPDVGGDAVILSPPCRCVVDGVPVDRQPLAHLPQTLFEDRRDPPFTCGADVHQQVSAAGHGLHQRLEHARQRWIGHVYRDETDGFIY